MITIATHKQIHLVVVPGISLQQAAGWCATGWDCGLTAYSWSLPHKQEPCLLKFSQESLTIPMEIRFRPHAIDQ